MQSLKELILRHADSQGDFTYYLMLIDKAERNQDENPDVAIECCNSLFQGISKSIALRTDPLKDLESFEKQSLQQQVREAFKCLQESDDIFEINFARSCENLTRSVAELRNARGDICHGRAVPKELQSDKSLSRLILDLSEALLRYLLASYFSMTPEKLGKIDYEKNIGFNDELDADNPLDGKVSFSRALYDQYYEDYEIRLKDWIDQAQEYMT